MEEFLEAEGFFFDEDREIYSVPFRDLICSELIDTTWGKYRTDARVVSLKDFKKYREFHDYLQKDGIPLGVDLEERAVFCDRSGSFLVIAVKKLRYV